MGTEEGGETGRCRADDVDERRSNGDRGRGGAAVVREGGRLPLDISGRCILMPSLVSQLLLYSESVN